MTDAGGMSLHELFRAEVEEHTKALNDGLLALEQQADPTAPCEVLMRAAHSVKGAARIIGLDAVVQLSHRMEDSFEKLKRGSERVSRERIDQLLRATDLLAELATASESEASEWGTRHAAAINEITTSLDAPAAPAAASPASAPAPSPAARPSATPPPPPPPAPAPTPLEVRDPGGDGRRRIGAVVAGATPHADATGPATPATDTADDVAAAEQRTVKVNAENLDRMMRLAGESMIEARRSPAVRATLGELKSRMLDLRAHLDTARRENGDSAALQETMKALQGLTGLFRDHVAGLDHLFRRTEEVSTALYHEVIGSRMRPFSDGVGGFPRMVRDLARQMGKDVRYELVGGHTPVDRDILAKLEAPLTHMLRNAVDHAVEAPAIRSAEGKPPTATITLEARHRAGSLLVRVQDDGRGIDPQSIRRKVIEKKLATEAFTSELSSSELFDFLFLPGFSTAQNVTEISGRGVGLDVVHRMVQEASGTVSVQSEPGRGTIFSLRLPLTLSVLRAALVEIGGEPYAFSLARLERIVRVPTGHIRPVEGRSQFDLEGRSVGLMRATALFKLPDTPMAAADVSVVVLAREGDLYGVVVDRFLGEQDLVVHPLDRRLGKVPCIAAGAMLDDGAPVLIIDTEDLLAGVRKILGEGQFKSLGTDECARPGSHARRRVLVVDDSITVREVERQLLLRLGYDVEVAVDGVDGWNQLRAGTFDLLVTDVDMPRMNGIELTQLVRRDPRLANLPIAIVSYKDRESDRRAGLDAGANAYLTKGSFQDETFAQTVVGLIGAPEP